jgi:hypothetical protein
MNYICALTQQIEKDKNIRAQLMYYPNTSIYKVGENLRYVEYKYQGTRRFNRISSVELPYYLNKILALSQTGAVFSSLVASLVSEDEEIDTEEATEYIHDLIDSQLLVSELEPSVTNIAPLSALIVKLRRLKNIDKNYISVLETINSQLRKIDGSSIGSTNDIYPNIIQNIRSTNIQSEIKYLFQTDLFKPVQCATVSYNLMKDVQKTLDFLNKINQYGNQSLTKFKDDFYRRYEDREMPLLYILDTEIGIPYQNVSGDISPLVDDLAVAQRNEQEYVNTSFDSFQNMMIRKCQEAFQKNSCEIILTDEDVKGLPVYWDDMPPSISVMCQILEDAEDKRLFYIKSVGGSSAANLTGRFCHLDAQIFLHTLNITAKEAELNPDVIYAEIVHLPESRIGNILLRPILRPYEISYLAKSAVLKDFEIRLSDLFVSVKNNRIILKSKQLSREIVPRMSTAHNYRLRSMPVYQFLCDMQHQTGRVGLGFYWNSAAQNFDFLPRVSYRNCILSKARWTVQKQEIAQFVKIKNDDELTKQIDKWLTNRHIPNQTLLADGDNALYVNFQDPMSVRS